MRVEDLGEPIQKLIKGLNRDVSSEEVAILQSIGVREMAQVYEDLEQGVDAEAILGKLKATTPDFRDSVASLSAFDEAACVRVSNLPDPCTDAQLEDVFGCCGDIMAIDMQHPNVAIITYSEASCVDSAVQLNGVVLESNSVVVERCTPQKQHGDAGATGGEEINGDAPTVMSTSATRTEDRGVELPAPTPTNEQSGLQINNFVPSPQQPPTGPPPAAATGGGLQTNNNYVGGGTGPQQPPTGPPPAAATGGGLQTNNNYVGGGTGGWQPPGGPAPPPTTGGGLQMNNNYASGNTTSVAPPADAARLDALSQPPPPEFFGNDTAPPSQTVEYADAPGKSPAPLPPQQRDIIPPPLPPTADQLPPPQHDPYVAPPADAARLKAMGQQPPPEFFDNCTAPPPGPTLDEMVTQANMYQPPPPIQPQQQQQQQQPEYGGFEVHQSEGLEVNSAGLQQHQGTKLDMVSKVSLGMANLKKKSKGGKFGLFGKK